MGFGEVVIECDIEAEGEMLREEGGRQESGERRG